MGVTYVFNIFTERVVANQIQCHMIKNNLFPQLQSAYRSHHNTETAALKVRNDLLMNMNKGHVSLLVLLDLSAAFDTVDHKILLKTLQMKLGVCGSALSWFKSYLEGRSQRICIKETLSQSFDLKWGVPQGSCLDLLLFTIYSSDLFSLLESHLPSAHAYANDTQFILVPRGRAPFGQHQESRPLARSSDIPFLNGYVNTID